MKHVIDLDDFSLDEVDLIIKKAFEIKKNPEIFSNEMKGKILATLFFEPSTRTQFSFQTAILKLGGQFIGFSNYFNSSVAKGESFKDTIKVVSSYADILVVRHFLEGASFAASLFSSCPVINAGDGAHLHPTQTLTDIFTILENKKSLNGLKIGICGDLKFGRTVNSLVKFLTRFKDNEFYLISSEDFRLSLKLKEEILSSGNRFFEISSLKEAIGDLDVLYMTRIQKERFKDKKDFENVLNILDVKTLELAKENLVVLHPLPRTKEISIEVDKDPRALYFTQTLNGVFVRMALFLEIVSSNRKIDKGIELVDKICTNENCITKAEIYLPQFFKKANNEHFCRYCDEKIV